MKNSTLTACILIAVIGLSACAVPSKSFAPTTMRNAVQVAESIERLELYTRPNGMELSARDKLAVAQFLDGYARSGDGPLYVNRPANALSGLGTQQAEAVIRGLMMHFSNQPHSTFGCFQSANLAAMVTDPRQLLEPYASGQPNAQRRQVIYDKYIQGEPTAAQVNPDQRVGAQE